MQSALTGAPGSSCRLRDSGVRTRTEVECVRDWGGALGIGVCATRTGMPSNGDLCPLQLRARAVEIALPMVAAQQARSILREVPQ